MLFTKVQNLYAPNSILFTLGFVGKYVMLMYFCVKFLQNLSALNNIGFLHVPSRNIAPFHPASLKKYKNLALNILLDNRLKKTFSFFDDVSDVTWLDAQTLIKKADMIVSVDPVVDELQEGKFTLAQYAPFQDAAIVDRLKEKKVQAFSLDMIPRTTRAQAMDVLSSMASLAGYKAVLLGAEKLPRYLSLMMTAAGTIKPSRILIIGAGVAGLQAIATSKRLGAIVEAFDTRTAVKEEVESLGGKFVEVEGAKDDKAAGGYAVEQTEEYKQRQKEKLDERAGESDIIITTAQVRGRKAPVIITEDIVNKMRKGSVIIDLAASTGGNCAVTQNNKVIDHKGITVVGNSYLADSLPQTASELYSNNVFNFIELLVKDGQLVLDMEDDILAASLITKTD